MAYLVVLIVDNLDLYQPVLDAWEAEGVTGVTILESSGLGRARRAGLRQDDFPLLPSLRDILQSREYHHRTLLSVVDSDAKVEALARAAESVMGDLNQPNTGLMFVIELYKVYGLQKPALQPNPESD
jgi:nitrogen regulatory protein PII